jgi:REP element-mobilizing transposase RayT
MRVAALERVWPDSRRYHAGGEMPYNSKTHHRRSIRLQNYDYSQPGAYFVTICAQDRICLFGDVVDGEMRLNDAGTMVTCWYNELARKFGDIACDAWVCMPNHIHFIVINTGPVQTNDGSVGADLSVRPLTPTSPPELGEHAGSCGLGEHAGSCGLGEHVGSPLRRVVQWFKTMSTNEYIRGVRQHRWTPFPGRLWQRNYWEHIVRDETELNRIREYIATNPIRWATDRLHPDHCPGTVRENPAIYDRA